MWNSWASGPLPFGAWLEKSIGGISYIFGSRHCTAHSIGSMIYRCLYYSAYDCSKKQKTNRIYVYSTHSYPYLADTRLTFVRAECCASTEANASGMQRREWNTKFRNRKFALHERRSSVAAGKANGEQRTESVCDKKTQSWLAHDNSALYLYLAAKGGLVFALRDRPRRTWVLSGILCTATVLPPAI